MKIYLASTASGTEGEKKGEKKRILDIRHRLLRYYIIQAKMFEEPRVFDAIVKARRKLNANK